MVRLSRCPGRRRDVAVNHAENITGNFERGRAAPWAADRARLGSRIRLRWCRLSDPENLGPAPGVPQAILDLRGHSVENEQARSRRTARRLWAGPRTRASKRASCGLGMAARRRWDSQQAPTRVPRSGSRRTAVRSTSFTEVDLPASTGPGLELVYAASWFMGNPSLGTMISGAGGR